MHSFGLGTNDNASYCPITMTVGKYFDDRNVWEVSHSGKHFIHHQGSAAEVREQQFKEEDLEKIKNQGPYKQTKKS